MEKFAPVIRWLEEAGCCCRCILRYIGECDYKAYAKLDVVRQKLGYVQDHITNKDTQNGTTQNTQCTLHQDEGKSLEEEQPSKRIRTSVCISCIGLLQDGCDSSELDKIVSEIEQSKCRFTSFVIHLSVPVTVELRQHMLLLHMQEKFSDLYDDAFVNKIASVKDVWKWVVGSYVGRTFKADFHPYSNFQIEVQVLHESLEKECNFLLDICPEAFPAANMKKKVLPEDIITRAAIQRVFQLVSKEKLKKLCPLYPEPPSHSYTYGSITCVHQPLYVAGRYNKYSRKLSQTPWVVDGERRMETSVQEIIENVARNHISADKIVFSSSGREDVDVQMLGRGRPFVLEFINPLCREFTAEKMKCVQDAINESSKDVFVRDLQVIKKEDLQRLKEGEEGKKKVYMALCCASKQLTNEDVSKISSLSGLVIKQKTPIRVLHRRTSSTRERTIHSMSAEVLENQLFRLHITTQAGTYVKEFVHGDFGRTMPNLGTLLECETDILELDVEEIDLDWPPQIDGVPCKESNKAHVAV